MSLKANDYECEKCGFVKEFFARDDDYLLCPKCSNPMKKLMPSVGLINPTPPGLHSGPLKEGGRKLR